MNSTTSDVTATAPKLLIQVLIVQEIPEVNGVSKWPQQEICSDQRLIGHENLRMPHPGIAIEHAVKATLLYRLLNKLRIMNETAKIRAKQPKAKIPQVIEKLADKMLSWISESDCPAGAGDCCIYQFPWGRVATNDLVQNGDIGAQTSSTSIQSSVPRPLHDVNNSPFKLQSKANCVQITITR